MEIRAFSLRLGEMLHLISEIRGIFTLSRKQNKYLSHVIYIHMHTAIIYCKQIQILLNYN